MRLAQFRQLRSFRALDPKTPFTMDPTARRAIDETRNALKSAIVSAGKAIGITLVMGRPLIDLAAGVSWRLEKNASQALSHAVTWMGYADTLQDGKIPANWENIRDAADLDERFRTFLQLGPKLVGTFASLARIAWASSPTNFAVSVALNIPGALLKVGSAAAATAAAGVGIYIFGGAIATAIISAIASRTSRAARN